jgi:hypothetical protein
MAAREGGNPCCHVSEYRGEATKRRTGGGEDKRERGGDNRGELIAGDERPFVSMCSWRPLMSNEETKVANENTDSPMQCFLPALPDYAPSASRSLLFVMHQTHDDCAFVWFVTYRAREDRKAKVGQGVNGEWAAGRERGRLWWTKIQ